MIAKNLDKELRDAIGYSATLKTCDNCLMRRIESDRQGGNRHVCTLFEATLGCFEVLETASCTKWIYQPKR